jgi:membrane protein
MERMRIVEKGSSAEVRHTADASPRQAEEASPWKLGGLSLRELLRRTWASIDDDNVVGYAAQLAYYFFLAMFPLLFFVLSLVGLAAHGNPNVRNQLLTYLGQLVPAAGSQLIATTVEQTTRSSTGLKLILGLLAALWSASAGMSGIESDLNRVYDVKERPWYKSKPLDVVLTIVVAALTGGALLLVLFGNHLADTISRAAGWGGIVNLAWKMLQYPAALFFMIFTYALIYFFAPNVKEQKWHWITPGSVLGVFLWIVASVALRVYLHYFNSYAQTYGALGAVVILMLWFYITGLAILVGAEINAEIENAAAEHGRADAKLKGERKAPAA